MNACAVVCPLLLALGGVADAAPVNPPPDQDCAFVFGWSKQAYHISQNIGLDEAKWHLQEDGFSPEEFAVLQAIKHDAYHDLPALRRRVEAVCAEKEES